MKILIVCGFLGSGKTTFIQSMAKNLNKKIAIIENEFADLNLDTEILRSNISAEDADMKIVELSEGCICCSLNLDFTNSVLTIANTIDPDFLVVEPSGVAYISKIIAKLKKVCYERIELDAPILIVDGQNFKESMNNFKDYFSDQLSVSGSLLVSKSENFSPDDFDNIEKYLNKNPNTKFYNKHYSSFSKENWESLISKKIDLQSTEKENLEFLDLEITDTSESLLDNISISDVGLGCENALIRALNILISGVLGHIVRAKGYFRVKDFWVKFDLVEGQYAITGSDEMPDERVVVIGENLNKESIKMLFENKIEK